MSQKTYQRYTPEFKEQALGLLRRDHARLQAENDILKKAAIILGSRTLTSSAK